MVLILTPQNRQTSWKTGSKQGDKGESLNATGGSGGLILVFTNRDFCVSLPLVSFRSEDVVLTKFLYR